MKIQESKIKCGPSLYGFFITSISLLILSSFSSAQQRTSELFIKDWHFNLGDVQDGQNPGLDDSRWRLLDLPHDWSIEGQFRKDNPAGVGGGALPGGIGWYRKTFLVPTSDKDKLTFIQFDGVYRNSEVWINGHYLGKRPYGYSSFQYELTPFLKYGNDKNVLAVRVDNSQQPNSRWYSGSGIYRNVWLVTTGKVFVDHWGTFITASEVTGQSAKVAVKTKIRNALQQNETITLTTILTDGSGKEVATTKSDVVIPKDSTYEVAQSLGIENPELWSVNNPVLYDAITTVESEGKITDKYVTTFGIRTFTFDSAKGFFLNGKHLKILGICDHHDLGCLGSAINTRALQRQLEILKSMGCNGLRTSHNPPAPELLDLCDKMGFIVMDEAFDMWMKGKTKYDYHLDFAEWHRRDIEDMVLRDRNHPSVFIWSIGNEIVEQWDHKDSSGDYISRELAGIIRSLDTTRPITSNCNDRTPDNPLIRSGALDMVGFSYGQDEYSLFPAKFPGKKLIGSETTSALETRGHYDMPSDSIKRWPIRWDLPFTAGNPDNTVSAYDNVSAPWGATHEEAWSLVKKYDFVSGMYIWTGFDYLGEPTPYDWPSRSSYFGIMDLAGFPKDVYYMYQGEWTNKPVLHLFPHWNWKQGQTIDAWVYTNCDEVELFLNGKSLGTKKKTGDELHLMWRITYEPGTLKAVGHRGNEVMTDSAVTAGQPTKIVLEPDRKVITADGRDLSFVTVKVLDDKGTLVPGAHNLIHFKISGEGKIAGVDNGSETDHDSFKADYRRAFNGLALVVVQSTEKSGQIKLEATSDGLNGSTVVIDAK
ncbi:MAG TPA: beta-galactosidase GalB [Candidatus Acidoferrales bacterium]|nr:beta-galactosidase GalB [Candidatus Acidoferrales bacterium]